MLFRLQTGPSERRPAAYNSSRKFRSPSMASQPSRCRTTAKTSTLDRGTDLRDALESVTAPCEWRTIFIRIASSPSADFRASSIGSGAGSGTAYCPPVICWLNEAKFPGDGEYIANRPPTNDPALAFLRSIWPASSPLKKSDTTSLDADL